MGPTVHARFPHTAGIECRAGPHRASSIYPNQSRDKVETGYLYSGTVSLTATRGCRLFCSALPVRSA